MMSHARSAWWLETKSYAPRKPRHPLASLGNPKKKKSSLLFLFSRGWVFSKMGRTFFFFGWFVKIFFFGVIFIEKKMFFFFFVVLGGGGGGGGGHPPGGFFRIFS